LPDQSNGQRGSGLGLAICHDLVELMGGQIGVASREGGGSAFHFSLPLEAVEPVLAGTNSKQTALAAAPSGEPIRILAAEDSEDNRLLLEHYLRNEPVKLRMAQNGQEALDAIQQGEQFDLILMDIDMPLMDGYTATRRILDCQQARVSASSVTGQNETTPIVALSADAMREAVRASLDAGCVAHVAKPVDRETLLKTIRRFARIPAAPGVGAGPAVSAAPAVSAEPPVAPSATIVPIRPAVAVSEQIKALVPNYLATKETQIQEARGFLAARDFDPIRSFGHNLKGTGRSYGFPPMEEMGREIERAAAQADTGRIAEQLDALDRFVSESAAALASA
jgi:CheY-like chemotaxis protein/HPt (histidine-containing phosphotransfer) domain-containing protein